MQCHVNFINFTELLIYSSSTHTTQFASKAMQYIFKNIQCMFWQKQTINWKCILPLGLVEHISSYEVLHTRTQ